MVVISWTILEEMFNLPAAQNFSLLVTAYECYSSGINHILKCTILDKIHSFVRDKLEVLQHNQTSCFLVCVTSLSRQALAGKLFKSSIRNLEGNNVFFLSLFTIYILLCGIFTRGALPYKPIRDVPFFRVSFFTINS